VKYLKDNYIADDRIPRYQTREIANLVLICISIIRIKFLYVRQLEKSNKETLNVYG